MMRRTPLQDDLNHALNLATYVAAALVLVGVLALIWHHAQRPPCAVPRCLEAIP